MKDMFLKGTNVKGLKDFTKRKPVKHIPRDVKNIDPCDVKTLMADDKKRQQELKRIDNINIYEDEATKYNGLGSKDGVDYFIEKMIK